MANITLEQIEFLIESWEILTEDQQQYLVENRIEFIKNANRDKISTSHDPESEKLGSDKIIDTISNKIDPTTKKEHTQWLVNRYKAGDFKLSDQKDIKKSLTVFESVKSGLENRNLNDIKSIAHLNDVISTQQRRIKLDKQLTAESDVKPLPEIFTEGGAVGYKVPSKATSIYNYGPAGRKCVTKWCTAAAGKDNAFNEYKGGKYTLHLANGNVLQLHHQSDQIKDENDHEINVNTNPRYSGEKSTIENFIRKTHELEGVTDSNLTKRHIPIEGADIDRLLDHHDKLAADAESASVDHEKYDKGYEVSRHVQRLSTVLASAKLNDEQFDRIQRIPTYNFTTPDTVDLTTEYAQSKFIPHEHISRTIDRLFDLYGQNRNRKYSINSFASNPNITSELHHQLIGKMLATGDVLDKKVMLTNLAKSGKNLSADHFNRIKDYVEPSDILTTDSDNTLPVDYLNQHKARYAHLVAGRKEITPELATELLGSNEPIVHTQLVSNHAVPKQIALDSLARTKRHPNIESFINRPDVTPDDVSHIVKQLASGTLTTDTNYWTRNNKLGKDDINTVIDSPHFPMFANILTNQRVRGEHLDRAIARTNNSDVLNTVLQSKQIKPRHIEAVVDKLGDNISATHLHNILDPEVGSDSYNLAPATALSKILTNNSIPVNFRHHVLFHPNVQLSHFESVRNDPRFYGAISNSENAPPSILHSLATSSMDHVRSNVAKNPNTSPATREILKNDQNPEIAAAANRKAK